MVLLACLGLVHCRIRLTDQLLGWRGGVGEGHADADRGTRMFAFELNRLFEDRDNATSKLHRCMSVLHIGYQYREFVATDTGDRVPWAHDRLQQGTNLHQHRVADVMTEGVIDGLEPV